MSKGKGKRPIKKNRSQLQHYKDFVSSSSYSPDSTIPSQNVMLVGSDEVFSSNRDGELHGKESIRKTPFRYRFIDWIKANLFAAIITAIVIGVATTVVTHIVKIAVITQRIDYIESKIEQIDDEDVEKDYLQIQLDLIKTEIENENNGSLNEINMKMKDIETRLNAVEEGGK